MATPSFLKKSMYADWFNFWCMFCSDSTKEYDAWEKSDLDYICMQNSFNYYEGQVIQNGVLTELRLLK